MSLPGLIALYTQLSNYKFEKHNDDDFVDKMSRKFSAIMMILFTIIITTYQLVGQPIKCWCPVEYSDSRCNYATTFCYITSQYIPVSNGTNLPPKENILSNRIMYYQWIAYIFLFQAVLFYFPCLIWRWLNTKSGFALHNYISELKGDKSSMKDNTAVRYVAAHIDTCLNLNRNYVHRGRFKNIFAQKFNIFDGSIMFHSYILVKIIYASIAFLQIFLLNYWLSNQHYSGKGDYIFGAHNWRLAERFPRMTLCKFQVFIIMFEEQLHWLQCALPINVYLEKFYVIIWLWLWIVFAATILSIVNYMPNFILQRKNFILARLECDNKDDCVKEFLSNINLDALLTIKLIHENTNEFYTTAVINQLNSIFQNRKSSY